MIIGIQDFPDEIITDCKVQKRFRGNPAGKGKLKYLDLITAFDIETTNNADPAVAWMYIWMWQFGEDITVIGRTWEEFKTLQKHIMELMPDGVSLLIWVHNLSFEFAFLSGQYPFTNGEVFAVAPRKVLKCTMYNRFEFRCSYLLSNMSLDAFTKQMKVKHGKMVGDLDYSIARYPWTELTETELGYCVNDVIGLVEAIGEKLRRDGDNFYSMPLTSTGYVRRDVKSALRQINHLFIKSLLPSWHVYSMLREAFRGGNTHASRFYAGDILENVGSADRSSSYPEVICNCEFPISTFYEASEKYDLNGIVDLMTRRHKALLMRVQLWEVEMRYDWWACPYLSRDKCRNVVNGVFDNGRILSADYLETTITDVDLKIILSEYVFQGFEVSDLCFARYGKLPEPLIKCVIDYYQKKTALKGKKNTPDEPDSEYLYARSKERLNSIYGLTAMDVVRPELLYDDGGWDEEQADPKKLLEIGNKKAIMPYSWGVWVTAHSRDMLERGIRLAGDKFVYCDTDSVKFIGDVDFSEFNEERIKASTESGAYADDAKGNRHYMGVFESEGRYKRFCTLGAKKYVYETEDGLHTTIAGVNKKKGGEELMKYGGITAFEPGFVFREAGGTESVYNDDPEPKLINVPGGTVEVRKGVCIRDSEYTLGITAEYERLLQNPKLLRRYGIDMVN